MSEPFIAEIRIFAGNFAPRGWAFCDGQLFPVAQNTALFALIGTTYGGDGQTTTALPNLRGRAPMHAGSGLGLTARRLGQRGGTEEVSLSEAQMPLHTHPMTGSGEDSDRNVSTGQHLGVTENAARIYNDATDALVALDEGTLLDAGADQAHNNMQPYLALNFIIALQGVYPSRD